MSTRFEKAITGHWTVKADMGSFFVRLVVEDEAERKTISVPLDAEEARALGKALLALAKEAE